MRKTTDATNLNSQISPEEVQQQIDIVQERLNHNKVENEDYNQCIMKRLNHGD